MAGRLFSYLSFLAGALWHGIRHPAPDVIVTMTTPPLISLVGMAIQKLRGARHIIWEMDLYPDIAVDLGVLKRNGIAARLFGWLADLPRRHADRVIALGECMRARLLTHGLAGEKISVAENWADCDALPAGYRQRPPSHSRDLSIIYSGNFGRAHDASTIAGAMAELSRAGDGFQFIFGGGGSRQQWIRDFCDKHNVESVTFLPYCERSALRGRLGAGDICLVTQHADSAGCVVPSKAYGIMAAGRPVLYIGPAHSTTALMIKRYGCGWQIDCGDVRGLVKLLRTLSEHKERVRTAGQMAYQTFVNHYQRSLGVARMAAILHEGFEGATITPADETETLRKSACETASAQS
jgi:glycosyltransferase involved in cell wall biosynthesis